MAEAVPLAGGDPLGAIAPAALIDSLHAQGAAAFDPVGWRFIEALARRSAALHGAARCLVETRLHQALADFNARLQQAGKTPAAAPADPEAPGPLAELLAHIGRQEGTLAAGPAPRRSALPAAPRELKALRLYRDAWSRLGADQQLAESLTQAPKHAGPLNSHHLVLQALQHMRAVSPEYLQRFLAYAEGLLWLDGAHPAAPPAPKGPARGEGDRKRRGGRGTAP